MTDLKQLRTQIKQSMDKEKTADILNFIGYEVDRNYKLKLRPDEATPSASIRHDGFIKDFGGDFGGDVVALLHEFHGMKLQAATRYVADCLSIRYE